jgi:3-methylcrotonyl-CoA carboxylase alpha subunit
MLPLSADGDNIVAQIVYGTSDPAVSVDGEAAAADATVIAEGEGVYVLRAGRQTKVARRDLARESTAERGQSGHVRAPMHGKVLAVLVKQGASVVRGQRVAILEAMKMEHTLVAPTDGVVKEIAVAADAQVAEGATVMVIEAAEREHAPPFVPAEAETRR